MGITEGLNDLIAYSFLFFFSSVGVVFFFIGLLGFFVDRNNLTRYYVFFAIGVGVLLAIGVSFLFDRSDKFVGVYKGNSRNRWAFIQLKSDGTFESNFKMGGTREGKWEVIDQDVFYKISLENTKAQQIGSLSIHFSEKPQRLRYHTMSSLDTATLDLLKKQ